MSLKTHATTVLRSGIIQRIGPVRRMTEYVQNLKDELSESKAENLRLKRMLNLVGDQHKLYRSFADALAECETPEGYDAGLLSRYIVAKSSRFLKHSDRTAPVRMPDHLVHSVLVCLLVLQVRKALRVIDFGGGCAIPVAILQQ